MQHRTDAGKTNKIKKEIAILSVSDFGEAVKKTRAMCPIKNQAYYMAAVGVRGARSIARTLERAKRERASERESERASE